MKLVKFYFTKIAVNNIVSKINTARLWYLTAKMYLKYFIVIP